MDPLELTLEEQEARIAELLRDPEVQAERRQFMAAFHELVAAGVLETDARGGYSINRYALDRLNRKEREIDRRGAVQTPHFLEGL